MSDPRDELIMKLVDALHPFTLMRGGWSVSSMEANKAREAFATYEQYQAQAAKEEREREVAFLKAHACDAEAIAIECELNGDTIGAHSMRQFAKSMREKLSTIAPPAEPKKVEHAADCPVSFIIPEPGLAGIQCTCGAKEKPNE